jgi:hypothetical protein
MSIYYLINIIDILIMLIFKFKNNKLLHSYKILWFFYKKS